jgi:hypothetical protein
VYAEIVDNAVIKIHATLPANYKNISNFFALEPEQLQDLTWSGNAGVKFYAYVEQIPEVPPNFQLAGPEHVIDETNKQVTGVYTLVPNPPPPPSFPLTISARQIRLWLLQNGISLQDVTAAIEGIEDPTLRASVAIEWEYAPYVERAHPMLVPLAQALNLTEEDIDRGFIEAANI